MGIRLSCIIVRVDTKPIGVPKWMAGVFADSYLYPWPTDMGDPLLSPGLAGEALLREALPEKVCIVTCWGDGLLTAVE